MIKKILFTVLFLCVVPAALPAAETFFTGGCKEMHDEIERRLEAANFCTQTTDCGVFELGGPFIEFGCYHYVNTSVDSEEIRNMVAQYFIQSCGQMIDNCASTPDPVCVDSKCTEKPPA